MCITIGILLGSFAAAAYQIAIILDVNTYLVYTCVGIYSFVAAIGGIPINYCNDRLPGHSGMFIGLIFLLVGAWIRSFILSSIWYAILGTCITGFAPSFINVGVKVATLWFGKDERALMITVMTCMFPLGGIASLLLPPYIIPNDVL